MYSLRHIDQALACYYVIERTAAECELLADFCLALRCLNHRDRITVALLAKGHTQAEVGRSLGITRQGAAKSITCIKRRLLEAMNNAIGAERVRAGGQDDVGTSVG